MYISKLETMENIVQANKNLFWDGWTVVERFKNADGINRSDGIFFNGEWHVQQRFVPSQNGWKIPNKYVS